MSEITNETPNEMVILKTGDAGPTTFTAPINPAAVSGQEPVVGGIRFLAVRLSPAGREILGEGGVARFHSSAVNLEFSGATPQRVSESIWTHTLSSHKASGKPMFEIVGDASTPPSEVKHAV